MKYLLLIYDDEKGWTKLTEKQQQEGMALYMKFTQDLKDSGHWVASHQLQPIATATTVRERDGKRLVTDGPYAETREQLGGFYLIEAKNLDEALSIAARVPSAKWGAVEVRPVVERQAQAIA